MQVYIEKENPMSKAAETYCYDGSGKFSLKNYPTNSKKDGPAKEEIVAKFDKNLEEMAKLHDKFYADGREGVIFLFQAMDAAGKDSTIKRVINGFNPAGVYVYSFKQPTATELKHDYLWRFNQVLPARGEVAIFNRSYYEDVGTVRLHEFWKGYKMPERNLKKDANAFFSERYQQINAYEEYLYDNGYRVVKFFLNLSKDKQKERFLERIDMPEKNWKFSASDLSERARWDDYQKLYDDIITNTSTKHAPWYIIPADQKWYTRYLVSEVILDTLKSCKSKYPEMSDEEKANLAGYKKTLEEEH